MATTYCDPDEVALYCNMIVNGKRPVFGKQPPLPTHEEMELLINIQEALVDDDCANAWGDRVITVTDGKARVQRHMLNRLPGESGCDQSGSVAEIAQIEHRDTEGRVEHLEPADAGGQIVPAGIECVRGCNARRCRYWQWQKIRAFFK